VRGVDAVTHVREAGSAATVRGANRVGAPAVPRPDPKPAAWPLPTGCPNPVESRRLTSISGESGPSPFRVSFHGIGSQDRVLLEVIANAVPRVRIPPSPQVLPQLAGARPLRGLRAVGLPPIRARARTARGRGRRALCVAEDPSALATSLRARSETALQCWHRARLRESAHAARRARAPRAWQQPLGFLLSAKA
jgi:hypothetical protein